MRREEDDIKDAECFTRVRPFNNVQMIGIRSAELAFNLEHFKEPTGELLRYTPLPGSRIG